MRILAIDVGTGTQDILVFDTDLAITNCPKMVMPSPTTTLASHIRWATAQRKALLFTGYTMGGGPSKWALKQHLESGLKAYATPDAARTFDDDLAEIKRMGVFLVSPDDARSVRHIETLELRDVDLKAIGASLSSLGAPARFDLVAVAVQDHGAAPPHVSDRTFRFEHLLRRVKEQNDLLAFTYLPPDVPDYLTRMVGVVKSLGPETRTLLMDTGFAAVMGADEDPAVSRRRDRLILNLGNSHTICFHLKGREIQGMFEHHTHALDIASVDTLLTALVRGSLTNSDVFEQGGHGAIVLKSDPPRATPHFVAAVGPQRGRMSTSALKPYLAVPHGDMMMTGCFGLVRACALRFPEWREDIEAALSREES